MDCVDYVFVHASVCVDDISVVISHTNLKPLLLVEFKCALCSYDVTHTHTHTHTDKLPSGQISVTVLVGEIFRSK